MGATAALPLLDAMVPAATAQATDAASRQDPPRRHRDGARRRRQHRVRRQDEPSVVAGGHRPRLRPVAERPRAARAGPRHLTIVSNTDLRQAEAFTPPEIGGDHFRSSAVFLTQAHPKQTKGSDVRAGISIDQLYAQRVGAGHADPVDAAVHRDRRPGGRLRLRLPLRLHRHDQLGRRRRRRCR